MITEQGYGVVEGVLDAGTVERLIEAAAHVEGNDSVSARENVYGIRNLFGQSLAVLEMLVGQLFLVTALAKFIGVWRPKGWGEGGEESRTPGRRRRRDQPAGSGEPAGASLADPDEAPGGSGAGGAPSAAGPSASTASSTE